jgi:hypothetical protein
MESSTGCLFHEKDVAAFYYAYSVSPGQIGYDIPAKLLLATKVLSK